MSANYCSECGDVLTGGKCRKCGPVPKRGKGQPDTGPVYCSCGNVAFLVVGTLRKCERCHVMAQRRHNDLDWRDEMRSRIGKGEQYDAIRLDMQKKYHAKVAAKRGQTLETQAATASGLRAAADVLGGVI